MDTIITLAGQAAFLAGLGWLLWLWLEAKVVRPVKRRKAARAKRRAAKARAKARKSTTRRAVKVRM